MSKKIDTIASLVDALGGPSAVADWLGISQSAVSNWIMRDEIPPGWHLRLYLKSEELGWRVDPRLFGLASIFRSNVRRNRHSERSSA